MKLYPVWQIMNFQGHQKANGTSAIHRMIYNFGKIWRRCDQFNVLMRRPIHCCSAELLVHPQVSMVRLTLDQATLLSRVSKGSSQPYVMLLIIWIEFETHVLPLAKKNSTALGVEIDYLNQVGAVSACGISWSSLIWNHP